MNSLESKLNPNWVTGFVDAEGCFFVGVYEYKNCIGWDIRPSFRIKLHIRDKDLLIQIKSFFNDKGNIYTYGSEVLYRIQNHKDLMDIVIPHFNSYPLLTEKQNDFNIFKKILYIVSLKKHLSSEGLIQIIELKASLNKGLSDKIQKFFPDVSPIKRSNNALITKVDPNWFAGFFSGEGCFFVNVEKSTSRKLGYAVKMRIIVNQHSRDRILISHFVDLLGCGQFSERKNYVEFRVSDFEYIYTVIIPFFKMYKIIGVKLLDFHDFCLVADLIKNKAHLTEKGLEEIQIIKSKMNRSRY